MNDALFGQMLRHPPRRQFIIFWRNEALRDGFEGQQKAREVREVIQSIGFAQRDRRSVVPLAQLDQRRWRDCTLKMQMKLRLWQATYKGFDLRHSLSLVGGTLLNPPALKGLP